MTLISTSSNIGVPGIWIFRIDQGIVQACPNEGKHSLLPAESCCMDIA